MFTRRQAMLAMFAARTGAKIVDAHVHLFDPKRVGYHRDAPYQPEPAPVEEYTKFVRAVKIDHAVIVHPEPYQDDHRYLSYCFAHEPSPGFFKGTCLFDPILSDTPARMEALTRKHPGRIVALRIHEMAPRGVTPENGGAIKNRNMHSPAMKTTWAKARALGLAIQMHMMPYFAPQVGELAADFRDLPVIVDHLGRAGQGTPEDFAAVLALAKLPRVYMKFSGLNYSSKQKYPFRDIEPLVRRIYDAFGPERILWGGLGMNAEQYTAQTRLLDGMFAFAKEEDRERIRGANAIRLFGW